MGSVEAAQRVVDALHSGEAKIGDFKDFGRDGRGVTQVVVEFNEVTRNFYTKDLSTSETVPAPMNRFRVEGTGNKVKVPPVYPNSAKP